MEIGIIGLGKMGYNLALNMKEHNHKVVVFNRTHGKIKQAEKEGLVGVYSFEEMVKELRSPRIIWLMIPAGEAVDEVIERLNPLLDKEDVIIDGGNSNYKDTLRRYEILREKEIRFVDVGTSGGMEGARNGACMMVGAEDGVFKIIEPIIKDICIEKGYLHTGKNGSGHYVKMIHNGIEYAMLQAIGEGFEILEKSQFDLNYKEIARVWSHGSVIRGWLMELMERAFMSDPQLDSIKGVVNSSGEGLWTVEEALELKVPAQTIASALFIRYRSQQEDTFAGKVVSALRNEFGGHSVEKK